MTTLKVSDRQRALCFASLLTSKLSLSTLAYISTHPEFLEGGSDNEHLNRYKEAQYETFRIIFGVELSPATLDVHEDVVEFADVIVINALCKL